VVLEPPHDLDRVSSFLNIRVADIEAIHAEWSARGAEFLTPPKDRGREIRCYLRIPTDTSSRSASRRPMRKGRPLGQASRMIRRITGREVWSAASRTVASSSSRSSSAASTTTAMGSTPPDRAVLSHDEPRRVLAPAFRARAPTTRARLHRGESRCPPRPQVAPPPRPRR
jgi:hypothetical protein